MSAATVPPPGSDVHPWTARDLVLECIRHAKLRGSYGWLADVISVWLGRRVLGVEVSENQHGRYAVIRVSAGDFERLRSILPDGEQVERKSKARCLRVRV